MYPAFPGNIINENTPGLFRAARRSIERRQLHTGRNGGWPAAWRICLEARFHDPLECGHLIKSMGAGFGCGMLTSSGQQIDAIFGLGAGIAEMLLQSHMGYIELLPAVPADWYKGSYSGFRARGGFEVSCSWDRGHLKSGSVTAIRESISDSELSGVSYTPGADNSPAASGKRKSPEDFVSKKSNEDSGSRQCTVRAAGLAAVVLPDGTRICGKDQISFELASGMTAQLEFLPEESYPVEYYV